MRIARKIDIAYKNVFYIVDAYAFTSSASVLLVDILKGALHVDDEFDIVDKKGKVYATHTVPAIEKDRKLVPLLVVGDCSRVLIEESKEIHKEIMMQKAKGNDMYLVRK